MRINKEYIKSQGVKMKDLAFELNMTPNGLSKRLLLNTFSSNNNDKMLKAVEKVKEYNKLNKANKYFKQLHDMNKWRLKQSTQNQQRTLERYGFDTYEAINIIFS
jgi:hypothetical protein